MDKNFYGDNYTPPPAGFGALKIFIHEAVPKTLSKSQIIYESLEVPRCD